MNKFELLAEQYAKEKWPNDEIAEGWAHFDIMNFALWLDDQQKSGGKDCCYKCKDRDCEDEIKRTTANSIWSCPCHRGLKLCEICKEFACQCQKSGGKKKIEKLYGIFRKIIVGKEVFYGLTKDGADKLLDKLNELVKAHNENL